MHLPPASIAFAHHQFVLGGAERVSFSTADRLRKRHGLRAYFFAYHRDEQVKSPFDEDESHLLLMPNKGGFFTPDNVDYIIEQVRRYNIRILFVASPSLVVPERIRQETGCRLCYWLHSIPFWELTNKVENARTRASRSIGDWLLWHLIKKPKYVWSDGFLNRLKKAYRTQIEGYDRYICLCQGDKDTLVKRLALSSQEAQRIVPIINTMEPLPEVRLEEKQRQIVYLGRLSRADKRVDRLLYIWHRAHAQLPDWELKIYGKGREEAYLRCLAEKLQLPRLEFCGYRSDVERIYAEASVLCLTSTYEGWPLVLAEAQNAGVVPLAFDCSPGVRTVIGRDGQFGRLIVPFDREAYARALVEVCSDPLELRALQERILEHRLDYRPEVNDDTWDRLLSELLS
ncbi:glycosyltransferase [Porphyromonas sp. COT-239 OH1446]|uniref:glycosyltransferase n=1 Tax=Porphyromonas sp. COT-239 OH1446 TaxID=1515613 RepID=UPI00068A2379|nr:glycosyltransferase [Porphyromonas sp. COT-239 OH1446]